MRSVERIGFTRVTNDLSSLMNKSTEMVKLMQASLEPFEYLIMKRTQEGSLVEIVGGFKEEPTINEQELCDMFGAYIVSKTTGKRI